MTKMITRLVLWTFTVWRCNTKVKKQHTKTKNIIKHKHQNNLGEINMLTTIDKEEVVKTVENNVDNFVYEQIDLIKNDFNKIFSEHSLSAEAIDDLRKIQCIIDEAKKSEKKVKNLGDKLDDVLKKINEAIKANKVFLEKYGNKEIIPIKKAINEMEEILKSCEKKLDLFSRKLEFIKTSLKPIFGLGNLEKDSSKQVFKQWAEFIELFSEGLEEGMDFFKDVPFDIIEKLAKDILLLVSEKSYNNHKKDQYKRRLKLAASYIIKIVEKQKSNFNYELEKSDYIVVKDLRTLVHAQYKIAMDQMIAQVNLENIEQIQDYDDEIEEVDIYIDTIFHGTRNTTMS